MKPLICAAVMVALSGARPVFAQAAAAAAGDRLMRGDVAGTIGWSSVNRRQFESYNNWRTEGLFEVRGGWYWTNHLKTSVDVAATTGSELYGIGPVLVGGVQGFPSVRYRIRETHAAVSQAYQFGDNQWVHPYVAGGADVVFETRSQRDDPIFYYDPVTRQSRLLRDAVQHPDTSDVRVRGLLAAGVKGYVSRKAFLLTELRVTIGGRAEQVHWAFGFGVDF